jgi:hypothetical protein
MEQLGNSMGTHWGQLKKKIPPPPNKKKRKRKVGGRKD